VRRGRSEGYRRLTARILLRLGHLPAVWWQQLGTREFAFLHTVQKQQDNGAPWGEAVYRAKAADLALQSA